MNSEIKQILNIIEQQGYEAYLVGGFVRDYLLGKLSKDVDICTSALPIEIQKIFKNAKKIGTLGSLNIKTENFNYDITTFRKEKKFVARKPTEVEYTKNLKEDLKRRDFTMNAICMNDKGKIIDILKGREDLEKKIIRMIGNPKKRLIEDPLRMLRAIRFSCTLGFQIDPILWENIIKCKKQIRSLSKNRIKKEMNYILLSPNVSKGWNLLYQSGILEILEITPTNLVYVNDKNGMWAQIETKTDFEFTKMETKYQKQIKELLTQEKLTSHHIFNYGLQLVSIAAKIKNIPEKEIQEIYKQMAIYKEKEMKISFKQIQTITKKKPKEVKLIQKHLIFKILDKSIKNNQEELEKYLKEGMNL